MYAKNIYYKFHDEEEEYIRSKKIAKTLQNTHNKQVNRQKTPKGPEKTPLSKDTSMLKTFGANLIQRSVVRIVRSRNLKCHYMNYMN